MLSSITPLGERSRHNQWWITVAWYFIGSVFGGLTFGVASGALGAAAKSLWWPDSAAYTLTVFVVLVAGLLLDLGVAGPIPSIHRQVNEDWLTMYRGWVYGGGFGYQLGLGVVTIVPTAATYVAYAMAFLTASIPAGAGIGIAFGVARALPILAVRKATSPGQLRSFHREMQRFAPRVGRLTRAGLGIGVLLAAFSLTGGP